MRSEEAQAVARAVLYEGYLLYPYRPSAAKNRSRWSFGAVHPPGHGDRSALVARLLLRGGPRDRVAVQLRFLQALVPVESACESRQRALERQVELEALALEELRSEREQPFSFVREERSIEGASYRLWRLKGRLSVSVRPASEGYWIATVRVENTGDGAGESWPASAAAFLSANLALEAEGAVFISLLDFPKALRSLVDECRGDGWWPVLLGAEKESPRALAAPIILYDNPKVAPESAGDLFDSTEIDEILSLRILTLTDEEKREAAEGDPRVRELLERTAALDPERWARLHGTLRKP